MGAPSQPLREGGTRRGGGGRGPPSYAPVDVNCNYENGEMDMRGIRKIVRIRRMSRMGRMRRMRRKVSFL